MTYSFLIWRAFSGGFLKFFEHCLNARVSLWTRHISLIAGLYV